MRSTSNSRKSLLISKIINSNFKDNNYYCSVAWMFRQNFDSFKLKRKVPNRQFQMWYQEEWFLQMILEHHITPDHIQDLRSRYCNSNSKLYCYLRCWYSGISNKLSFKSKIQPTSDVTIRLQSSLVEIKYALANSSWLTNLSLRGFF